MHRDFCNNIITFFFYVNRISRNNSFSFINFFYKLVDTAFKLKNFFFWMFKSFIAEYNYNTRVQECKFTQTVAQNVIIISCCFCKNCFICLPADCCSVLIWTSIANNFNFCFWYTTFVLLLVNMSVAFYCCFHPVGKSVYTGNTNTMQTTGNFIRSLIKFTTGMQAGQNQFKCADFFCRVNVNRNTTSVIYNANNIITFKCNCNCITESGHCLIN